jgi:predicted component of type VI protein secretion system
MSNGAAPRRKVKDARLVVVDGKASRQEVPLKLPAVLGRGENVTVLIKDKEKRVSRTHCEVTELDGALVVRDLNSKNGTFINGDRVTEAILKPNDQLSIGPLTFRVAYSHQGAFPSLNAPPANDEQEEPALFEELSAAPSSPEPAGQGASKRVVSDDDIDFFLNLDDD